MPSGVNTKVVSTTHALHFFDRKEVYTVLHKRVDGEALSVYSSQTNTHFPVIVLAAASFLTFRRLWERLQATFS